MRERLVVETGLVRVQPSTLLGFASEDVLEKSRGTDRMFVIAGMQVPDEATLLLEAKGQALRVQMVSSPSFRGWQWQASSDEMATLHLRGRDASVDSAA